MNLFISYRAQSGLAHNAKEAKRIIGDFTNPDLNDYLKPNENISAWIDSAFKIGYNCKTSMWTTGSGYNKRVLLFPTEHDDLLKCSEELALQNRLNALNVKNAKNEEDKQFIMSMKKPRKGTYRVSVSVVINQDGEHIGEPFSLTVDAYSGMNAYNKVSDAAMAWCDKEGLEFVRVKSIKAKTTSIEYLGE